MSSGNTMRMWGPRINLLFLIVAWLCPTHAFLASPMKLKTAYNSAPSPVPSLHSLPAYALRVRTLPRREQIGARTLRSSVNTLAFSLPWELSRGRFSRWMIYRLQQAMVSSVPVQILMLFTISAIIVLLGGIMLRLLVPDANKQKFYPHWLVRSYVLLNRASFNPMTADSRRETLINNILWHFNIVSIAVATGLVAATIKTKFDHIVNGNFPIVERHHTVLLMDQWNEQVVPIIQHLEAMSSLPGGQNTLRNRPVVVLSNVPKARAKAEIEEGLAHNIKRNVKVLVREGDPTHVQDLARVCIESADKVMLLTSDKDRQSVGADGAPSKTLVQKVRVRASLLRETRRRAVAAMDKGAPTAAIAVPGGEAHWREFESDFSVCEDQEFVGRLLALCTVESSRGLSHVYNTVLQPKVRGGNFYETARVGSSKQLDFMVGLTFGQLQARFPHCVVCGIVRDKSVLLAPAAGTEVAPHDSVVVFAQDRAQVHAEKHVVEKGQNSGKDASGAPHVRKSVWGNRKTRRILVLGWNERGRSTLDEIAQVCPKGSKIVALDSSQNSVSRVTSTRGVTVEQLQGGFSSPQDLRAAGAMESDCIVCLMDSPVASNTNDGTDTQLLRIIQSLGKLPRPPNKDPPRLVAMVHRASTLPLLRKAASEAGLSVEFILANELESGALVQVLMRPDLEKVFHSLLSASSGHELLVLPSPAFVTCTPGGSSVSVSFQDIQTTARGRGQVALGVVYRRGEPEEHELVLNPHKQKKLHLTANDGIVVIGDFHGACVDGTPSGLSSLS